MGQAWSAVAVQVIDMQAAASDREDLQNEASSYASRIVPEARGDAERILQGAHDYREQSVAEATGQSARFLKIYEEYKKAPEVTRKRIISRPWSAS